MNSACSKTLRKGQIAVVMKEIYRTASSMKAGMVLLGLVGAATAVGSWLAPEAFFMTIPFKLLLVLLFINMTLCTIRRIAGYLKRFSSSTNTKVFRLREAGIFLLHAGVLLVLIGGAAFAYSGQSAEIILKEGETVHINRFIRAERPFSLRLNRFEISYYPDGSPSQYLSDVSIIEGSSEIKRYSISVNHPLRYGGVKAYQQSFGYLVEAVGINEKKGERIAKSLNEGEFIGIPDTPRRVKMYKYIPNFDPRYGMESKTLRPDNPKVIYSVYEEGKLLGVGAASPGERIAVGDGCYVAFREVRPYSVLKLKTDPGIPLTAAGGLMLIAGVVLAVLSGKPNDCASSR
ncbi:MAG: cytochrome c biogenesis protein ResB [Thermacetogeniaceae bacterium]